MATKTHERADFRALRRKLEDLRGGADASDNVVFRAMDNLLTAAGYQDQALMRSAIEETKAALEVSVPELIEERVKRSASALDEIRRFTDEFNGAVIEPDEAFDDIGRSISGLVSTILGDLCDFRDGLVAKLRKHNIAVPNAAKLDEYISYWEAVKADLVDCWPWSNVRASLPSVDREMVARSRAAFHAGEQAKDIDGLIERLRSE